MKKLRKRILYLIIMLLVVIVGILVGIIINNSNSKISKQEEAGAEQLTQTTSSNAYVDMATHLSEVANSASSATKAIVFTSFPVDMTQYTDRWAELTKEDFKGGITKATANGWTNKTTTSGSLSGSASSSVSVTYNATTGQLKASCASKTNVIYDSNNKELDVGSSGSGLFVVWLGTIGGQ